MTTNQTIDGVPRELLRWLDDFINDGLALTAEEESVSAQLRTLLDAPAVQWLVMEVNGKPWVIKEGPNAEKWRAMGYELFPVQPAAQPQGEPVAHTLHSVAQAVEASDCYTVLTSNQCHSLARSLNKQQALYAEQPAPVAVVIDDNVEFEKWWMSTPILRKQKIQIAQEAWFARANLNK